MNSETQTTISGTVTQAIPPEKHRKYALGDALLEYAEGKYVTTVEDYNARPDSWFDRFITGWKTWFDDPGSTTEWIYHVVVDEPVAKGDTLTFEAGLIPDVTDCWDGTIVARE